jgi:glycosyltransferase involved in cell wall biosynthesis
MSATLTIPGKSSSEPLPDTSSAHVRRRVLVSAYAISPVRGSEPGMGWNICSRLAQHHDVTVLCCPFVPPREQQFREEIEKYTRESGPIPGLTFHFVEPPLASYLFQRETPILRRTLYYAGYKSWQRAAFRAAEALHERQPFDLVHQLNITGFREPGYLWRLQNVPFVWGPVGGASNVPKRFFSLMSGSERLFYKLRNIGNAVQKRTLRRCQKAARHASHIWVVGDANRELVENIWGCCAEPMLEVGGEPHPLGRVRTFDGNRRLKLVWSGVHIGRKALPLLLQALREQSGIELIVLGEGPETSAWKALAAQLSLDSIVRWIGRIPREDAIREMAAADVFVSSSVLEETSLVVLEALSLGLPVICHDACGMGVAVTDACGIKVPMRTPDVSIAGFRDAIRKLAAGGEAFRQMSAAAVQRARELSWDDKAAAIARTYESVINAKANK